MAHVAMKEQEFEHDPLVLNDIDRQELAEHITNVFSAWRLPTIDQALLLGLSANGRSTLNRYAKGHPVAQNRDLIWRIGHILAVYEILHASDLDAPERADMWPTKPNERLGGKRPIDFMRTPDGLAATRNWLEVTGAW